MNNINNNVLYLCKDLEGVNFIKLINHNDYINNKLNKKISFIIEYKKPNTYYNYNKEKSTDEYYYGLSAKLKIEDVAKLICSDILIDNIKLKSFLNENKDYFILDKLDLMNKFGEALFVRSLLQISLHYGFTFLCKNKDDFNTLETFSKTKNYHLYLNFNEKELEVSIKGRPSNEFINYFPFKISKNPNATFSNDGISLIDIYEGKSDFLISLLDKTYYSGVLPRLKQIVLIKDDFYNPNIISYKLIIEKTTYAFVESFDNTSLLEYDILAKYKDILIEFNNEEFNLEHRYIHKDNFNLDDINNYLNKTNNNNNIAVSANIITNDNYLLYGLRSNNSIDNGTIYCSVNGQSEIRDDNVNYYHDSAYEDYPTIDINSKDRIDFKKEFSREMIAELSLTGFEKNYQYLGISVLGIKKEKFNPKENRRLHFNILAEHITTYKYREIASSWENSLESFENKAILGLRLKAYHNKKELVFKEIFNFIKLAFNSKDIITIILAIITGSFIFGVTNINELANIIFTILFALIFIINIILSIKDKLNLYKTTTGKKYIYNTNINNCINKINRKFIRRIKSKKKIILSPIAILLTYLHIYKTK